jgi:hypothetical protein
MIELVDGYYTSERWGAAVCFSLTLLALGLGIYLVKATASFSHGVGWALLVASVLILVASGVYYASLGSSHATYANLLATDQAQFFAQEIDHVAQAVQSLRWVIFGETCIALAGIGIILIGQFRNAGTLSGIGTGIALAALLLAGYDSLNRERAMAYRQAVQALGTESQSADRQT